MHDEYKYLKHTKDIDKLLYMPATPYNKDERKMLEEKIYRESNMWEKVRDIFKEPDDCYDIKFIENYIKPETTINLLKTSYMIYQEVADEAIKNGECDGLYIRHKEYPKQSPVRDAIKFRIKEIKEDERKKLLGRGCTEPIIHHLDTFDPLISRESLLICKLPGFMKHMK